MSDLAGRSLGPYRLLEQVGGGGMATVYKAYHAAMDRYVAIKVLPRHLARDPSFRARFEREARTIARLEHRYILPVYDAAEDDGIPYLVMRYTDSGDLGSLIVRGQLTIRRTVQLTEQVAEALDYAHRQGVVHRDVKPANVLISREGDALLADFGIAKIYADTLQLTGEGSMVGTPAYMAPEQLQGKDVDARTDIYALGVVLYQALTGECPFVAETPLAVALMHIHNPLRPPRQINHAIPEALERIILRAMAKSAADRFQSAGEMAETLRQAGVELNAAQAAAAAPAASPPRPAPATTPLPAEPAPAPDASLAAAEAPTETAASIVPARRPGITRRRLIAGGVGLAVLAVALLALGAGTFKSALPGLSSEPTVTPNANLRVWSAAADTRDLVAVGDSVWAATAGGLVRYEPDGTSHLFTTADGLPFNNARAIVAARDGVLWVAGDPGVARIRPVAGGLGDVRFFDDSDGLDIGDPRSLMIDTDGSVWAGGASYAPQHVVRFDGATWGPPSLPTDAPAVPKDLRIEVNAMLRASDGALWLGLADDGLLRLRDGRWTYFTEAQGVGKAAIYRLFQDSFGTIWAATGDKGLLRFDSATDRWKRASVLRDDLPIYTIAQVGEALAASCGSLIARSDDRGTTWRRAATGDDGFAGTIVAIARDAAGAILLGGDAGVSRFADGHATQLAVQSDLPERDIGRLAYGQGKLWALPTYGGPATTFDPSSLEAARFTGRDVSIYAVAFGQDTLWAGTTHDGLLRQRGGESKTITTADGLPSDAIRALLVTDTTLWIGTDKGLAAYDLAAGKITGSVPEFNGGIVSALMAGPDGAIWAGSHRESDQGFGALGRFDGQAWRVWRKGDLPQPDDEAEVTAFSADEQQHVWAATWGGGAYIWDGAQWRSLAAEPNAPRGNVLALMPRGGTMWVGGAQNGRLFRWTASGWKSYKIGGLSSPVNDLYFAADGALWLATNDGLLRLSPQGVADMEKQT
jgi:ligand-binding sensor domain-containing protein/tRNA A-37 threonylcarbamoyl transferase component Bud32